MRYEGASNEEIITAVPEANDSLIGTYAPSELRGGKRLLAEYIEAHPGVDYKDIPFWNQTDGPSKVGGQLRDLSRAGLITYSERPIAAVNGHGAKGNEKKGFFNIRLTRFGQKRVEASRIKDAVAAKSSEAHADIVERLKLFPPQILPPQVLDMEPESEIGLPDDMSRDDAYIQGMADGEALRENGAPEASVTAIEPYLEDVREYPNLFALRDRAAKIKAANDLVQQAASLYADAGVIGVGLRALEEISGTAPAFTPTELEYMKLWGRYDELRTNRN